MITPIHALEPCDRPREKLQKRGVRTLSSVELLEVIIGNGTKKMHVGQIALALQSLVRKNGLSGMTFDALRSISGLSTAKASRLIAAVEFVRRQTSHDGQRIARPEDVLPLASSIRTKKQEHLLSITLDGSDSVLSVRTISVGTLTSSLVHPREVFADAIAERAAGIILVHNHPSGSLEPSAEDRRTTAILADAGRLLGIPVRDHVIVTSTGWCSMRIRGLLPSS